MRSAQQAGDRLAAQQAHLMEQQRYMMNAVDQGNFRGDSSKGGKGKGGKNHGGANNGGLSKRKIKSNAYVSWIREVKQKKSGDWSSGWGGKGNHSSWKSN